MLPNFFSPTTSVHVFLNLGIDENYQTAFQKLCKELFPQQSLSVFPLLQVFLHFLNPTGSKDLFLLNVLFDCVSVFKYSLSLLILKCYLHVRAVDSFSFLWNRD